MGAVGFLMLVNYSNNIILRHLTLFLPTHEPLCPPAPCVGMWSFLGHAPARKTDWENSTEQKPCSIIAVNQIVNVFQEGFFHLNCLASGNRFASVRTQLLWLSYRTLGRGVIFEKEQPCVLKLHNS